MVIGESPMAFGESPMITQLGDVAVVAQKVLIPGSEKVFTELKFIFFSHSGFLNNSKII